MEKGYILIQDWMLRIEGLSLTDIAVFAIIYGFSQDGESSFRGSQQWLADKLNVSKDTVKRSLKTLVDRQLVEKIDKVVNGVKFCQYKTICVGVVQNQPGGRCNLHHNNKDINKDISLISEDIRESARAKFIPPTLEEVKSFVFEKNLGMDAERFYNHYTSNGWKVGRNKMVDWKAACYNWLKKEKEFAEQRKVAQKESKKEDWFEHNLRVMDEMNGTNLHEQYFGNNGNGNH